jgi:phosphotransferase system IIA component
MTLQELTYLITVISFLGGIAIFLFKKIVIEPLQGSINSLNETLKAFKLSTNKQIDLHEQEIDLLKEKTTRHDEQIKTLFSKGGE